MTDLIDRQALLKELPYANWSKDWDEALAKAIIENMPQAQQWIPASEGLPSYGEDVLLSIGRYATVGYLVPVSDDDGGYNWFYSGWYHSLSDVDAWMPMPEPYKEAEDVKQNQQ